MTFEKLQSALESPSRTGRRPHLPGSKLIAIAPSSSKSAHSSARPLCRPLFTFDVLHSDASNSTVGRRFCLSRLQTEERKNLQLFCRRSFSRPLASTFSPAIVAESQQTQLFTLFGIRALTLAEMRVTVRSRSHAATSISDSVAQLPFSPFAERNGIMEPHINRARARQWPVTRDKSTRRQKPRRREQGKAHETKRAKNQTVEI